MLIQVYTCKFILHIIVVCSFYSLVFFEIGNECKRDISAKTIDNLQFYKIYINFTKQN